MKQYESIADYTFSGRFVAPIEDADVKDARVVIADIELVRPPSSPYYSNRTYPPNGFLATMVASINGFVLWRKDIEYEQVRVYLQREFDDQVMYALRCFDAISAGRDKVIAELVGGTVALTEKPFTRDLTALHLFPDRLNFQCYASTALKLSLQKLDVLKCDEEYPFDVPEREKPIPPEPPMRFEPFEPIPPERYSPNPLPDEPQGYEPFPLDISEEPENPFEPPFGEEGESYQIAFDYDVLDSLGNVLFATNALFQGVPAPIIDFGISNDLRQQGSPADSVGAYAIGSPPNDPNAQFFSGQGSSELNRVANLRNLVIT